MNLKEKFESEFAKGNKQFTHHGRIYKDPIWSFHHGCYHVVSYPVGRPDKAVVKYIN